MIISFEKRAVSTNRACQRQVWRTTLRQPFSLRHYTGTIGTRPELRPGIGLFSYRLAP
jgi:hypothetical protein